VGPGQVALYRDVVAPLLARRCGECHLGQHSEGGMRVDDLAKLVVDKDLVPGKPGDSPIVQRMGLAPNNADRMPPPEKPPVDAWETAAVAAWVTSGGKADSIVAVNDLPPGVAKALDLVASPAAAPAASTATGSAPPGSVVPLRAAGCGSCAVGSGPEGSTFALGVAATLVLVLGARRRREAAISS
jgi:MYXO-CTERM domain-containing protein